MRSVSVSASLSNHYETLGIDQSADAKQIKAAYYELSKKYHPDRHIDADDKQYAAIKFQEVYFDKVQPMWKRREGGRLYHPPLPCVSRNHGD
uniref:J domain-containing protein n=1 Tax=Parascaris equorum TaxID=6256 RepID=A0A914RAT3_PAREQ